MSAKRRPTFNLPRPIRPELVEIGDELEVTLPAAAGMTVTRRGVVADRVDLGTVRRYVTYEGGVLCAWEPGIRNGMTLTLHSRKEESPGDLAGWAELFERARERAE